MPRDVKYLHEFTSQTFGNCRLWLYPAYTGIRDFDSYDTEYFPENSIETVSPLDSEFKDLPCELATTPSMTLKFWMHNLNADLREYICSPLYNPIVQFTQRNRWVLECDGADGETFVPIFEGFQKLTLESETKVSGTAAFRDVEIFHGLRVCLEAVTPEDIALQLATYTSMTDDVENTYFCKASATPPLDLLYQGTFSRFAVARVFSRGSGLAELFTIPYLYRRSAMLDALMLTASQTYGYYSGFNVSEQLPYDHYYTCTNPFAHWKNYKRDYDDIDVIGAELAQDDIFIIAWYDTVRTVDPDNLSQFVGGFLCDNDFRAKYTNNYDLFKTFFVPPVWGRWGVTSVTSGSGFYNPDPATYNVTKFASEFTITDSHYVLRDCEAQKVEGTSKDVSSWKVVAAENKAASRAEKGWTITDVSLHNMPSAYRMSRPTYTISGIEQAYQFLVQRAGLYYFDSPEFLTGEHVFAVHDYTEVTFSDLGGVLETSADISEVVREALNATMVAASREEIHDTYETVALQIQAESCLPLIAAKTMMHLFSDFTQSRLSTKIVDLVPATSLTWLYNYLGTTKTLFADDLMPDAAVIFPHLGSQWLQLRSHVDMKENTIETTLLVRGNT